MSERQRIFSSVKDATVAIAFLNEGDDGKKPYTIVGSGFCVDPSGIVMTCEHVLSAPVFMPKPIEQQIQQFEEVESKEGVSAGWLSHRRTPYAIFFRTDTSPHHLVAIPTQVNLAMCKTNFDHAIVRVTPHAFFAKGFPFLEIEDYNNIYEGQEIATCGFPLGNYLQEQVGTVTSSFTEGIVSSIIPAPNTHLKHLKGFQLNLTATHGNSGGPVFSLATGKAFGVLQRSTVDHNQNVISNLIKAEPVYPCLEHDSLNEMKSGQAERKILEVQRQQMAKKAQDKSEG